MSETSLPVNPLTNGVKLLGEVFLPGASLLMDGKFADGAAHAVVGLGARLMFGPLGGFVVSADSFSKSVADRNLWDYARPAVAAVEQAAGGKPTKAA